MFDDYLLALVAAACVFLVSRTASQHPKLDHIPSVRQYGLLGSWPGSLEFYTNAGRLVKEGYTKFHGRPFKVPSLHHWNVIVGTPQHIDDIRKASDDVLSFDDATSDIIEAKYTLGPDVCADPFHLPVVRSQLTRNLGVLFSDIHDEIAASFRDEIPLKGDDWLEVPALPAMMQVVCRTSNRIFVGLPLCREPGYKNLMTRHTVDVVKGGVIIKCFPRFLAPLVARYLTKSQSDAEEAILYLRPVTEERLKRIEEEGNDYAGKPNDFLSWLIDISDNRQRNVKQLTMRMLTINFAAIHTSSMSFTHALFNLAANPAWIKPLREEVDAVVETEGWSKTALVKMRKIDSFLKESARLNTIGQMLLGRKATKDFTFSDGTMIPKGTFVFSASSAVHRDPEIYEDPEVFKPFRFADMRDEEGEGLKHHMVTPSPSFLNFGYGKHACPGRFFAANELKTMLAHVVTNYDIKLADEGVRPKDLSFAETLSPHPTATVMWRKRRD
ncbi:cytochrome P450 [Coniophora puteana RWD-64-598 SS2]|uniref:Cytochrome P450 n=1 Tax=Coniophora puteana (strain RWD-64-598) TaxID=741705 RepID=A0A5M3MX99_CONPW|nr:cytochrome P450 [Coniophora puteana RWD-64-598 SS2]EIW83355.1 cytochrome P450 [Coniophora puteana RWD-64-598 SS2]